MYRCGVAIAVRLKVLNRWRVEEKATRTSSAEKHSSMSDHYSNARDLMPVTWKYSYCQ